MNWVVNHFKWIIEEIQLKRMTRSVYQRIILSYTVRAVSGEKLIRSRNEGPSGRFNSRETSDYFLHLCYLDVNTIIIYVLIGIRSFTIVNTAWYIYSIDPLLPCISRFLVKQSLIRWNYLKWFIRQKSSSCLSDFIYLFWLTLPGSVLPWHHPRSRGVQCFPRGVPL